MTYEQWLQLVGCAMILITATVMVLLSPGPYGYPENRQ